jgi:hypothetical protein
MSQTFTFKVLLRGPNGYLDFTRYVQSVSNWYIGIAAEYEIQDLELTYIANGIFSGKFTPRSSNPKYNLALLAAFVDPDEEGDSPIRIGKTYYCVIGELLSINEKSLE